MGFHLCRLLRRALDRDENPARVIAVSRFGDEEARRQFEAHGMTTLRADLTEPDEVARLPEAAAVFFLAGKKFGTSDAPETLHRFNEHLPALVAERYWATPIVALSTGCVYPFVAPESGGSKETDDPAPIGAYAISCLGRERAFLDASARHGTPLSLIRLSYAVDLRYGVLVDIAARVLTEQPVDVSMGHFNCIWQGDALDAIVRSLAHAAPAPEAFVLNVTGARTLSVRETAEWFGDRFGKSVTFTGSEAETAWLNDAGKCHELFGPPGVEVETLMEWVADWVENGRPLLDKPTHFEVRDGQY